MMQLGFFTMPIHPTGRDWRQILAEDLVIWRAPDKVLPAINSALSE